LDRDGALPQSALPAGRAGRSEERPVSLTVQQLIDEARTRVREVRPRELALLLRQAAFPVVDVREPEEFEDGHIPGAVNIPRGLLEFEVDGHPAVAFRTEEALSHRERPILLYCLSGGRSILAADSLRRMGFVMPMSLSGGFLGWADAGQPLVSPGGSWQPNGDDRAGSMPLRAAAAG
jgi:rhodanese-related sulfurtransferase